MWLAYADGSAAMGVLKACLNREWILVKRNSFVYVFKAVQVCIKVSQACDMRHEAHQQVPRKRQHGQLLGLPCAEGSKLFAPEHTMDKTDFCVPP